MHQIAASKDLERLNPFVGAWQTDGEMKASPVGPPERFKAIDTYEWLPGGFFLVHRFDADMPSGKVQGIEVIGYNKEVESYPMHSFDSSGNTSFMQARVELDRWTFVGEDIRFAGWFRDCGRVFAGLWELRSNDSVWQPWMDVKLTKIDAGVCA